MFEYCIKKNKKILYLSNREALDKQINKSFYDEYGEKRLKKIDIYTYQKFIHDFKIELNKSEKEEELKNEINKINEIKKLKKIKKLKNESKQLEKLEKKIYWRIRNDIEKRYTFEKIIKKYKYIVLDEVHFFTSDATFNTDCELLYDLFFKIFKVFSKKKFLILMSSTPHTFVNLPRIYPKKGYIYRQKPNYSYLNVKYFKENDSIIKKIVDDIKENSQNKWIIFVNSKNEGKEISNKLKEKNIKNSFLHSKNKSKEFENIVKKEKFDKNVLISTKILETGVNINDEDVKNIVMYDIDRETIIQEIGRVRVGIDKPRKINLYIPLRKRNYFYNIQKNIKKKLECIKSYNSNPADFFKKYQYQIDKIPSEIFYIDYFNGSEFHFSIRKTSKTYFEEKYKYLEKITDNFSTGNNAEYSFVLQVLEWLEIEDSFNIENLIDKNVSDGKNVDDEELKNYLEKNLENKLFSESQLELSALIKNTFGLSSNKAKKLRINTINTILEKHNINYILKSYMTSKRDKGNKNPKKCSYWIIEKDLWDRF
ncbi:TPA: DEAD/DEAH box helicase family protein [Clostridioides difficile]|nr:DEAD/DEAH box helicase family protein [Clostridioides difficile]